MNPGKNKPNGRNADGDRRSSGLNRDDIANQAYFFWLEGGCQEGCHEDDWFRAERYLSSQNTGSWQEFGARRAA
jgi:Protein of unknown function (DUF2934)